MHKYGLLENLAYLKIQAATAYTGVCWMKALESTD